MNPMACFPCGGDTEFDSGHLDCALINIGILGRHEHRHLPLGCYRKRLQYSLGLLPLKLVKEF